MSVSVRDALRMSALYLVLSVMWLVLSDQILSNLFDDPAQLARWELINAYAWMGCSAALIFVSRWRLLNFIGIGARLRCEDRERLHQIDGAMPRLNAIPRGCAYNPRCESVFDRCHVDRPDLLTAGATRAACWLHDASTVLTPGVAA